MVFAYKSSILSAMLDDLTQALLSKYDTPVPRYTSYPTANHFKPGGAREATDILAGAGSDTPLSLYIHIPFCKQLCYYCGCHTRVVNQHKHMEPYISALLREIALIAETLGDKRRVNALHFGGGTPNYLRPEDLSAILSALRAAFDIDDSGEISMEMDPRLITPAQACAYFDLGIGRVSLGVQDFNPRVQAAINRIQSFDMVKHGVDDLREAGFTALNLDLMAGLPHQSAGTVAETVQQALSLEPDRLAVFAYAHVPWMKKHQKLLEPEGLPGAADRLDMILMIRERLTSAGFAAIGMDHFAKPDDPLTRAYENGTLRRNFMGYTEDPNPWLLGLGASSISGFPHGFTQNITDVRSYIEALETGILPAQRYYKLSAEDRKRARLIENIMCLGRADISGDLTIPPDKQARLEDLQKDGLITWNKKILTITERGLPFSRLAAACLDEYYALPEQTGEAPRKHASAI